MKKIISILLFAFMSQLSYADGTNISGSGADDKGNHPHKAPRKPSTPLMSINQGVLSVLTNATLYNAELIICDKDGNVLYDFTDTICDDYAIVLPEFVSTRMYSIELICSDTHTIIYL